MKKELAKIKLFQNLDKEALNELANIAKIKEYKKGDLLYSDREKIHTIYFVIEGVASLYKPNPDNTKKVVFLFGAGDVLNEVIIYENTTLLSCEFLAPTKLLEIDREDFVTHLPALCEVKLKSDEASQNLSLHVPKVHPAKADTLSH